MRGTSIKETLSLLKQIKLKLSDFDFSMLTVNLCCGNILLANVQATDLSDLPQPCHSFASPRDKVRFFINPEIISKF